MSKRLKRIIAIIALVFVGVFTASLVAFLADRTLFNGAIGFLALFSGGIGLALFLTIKLSRDYSEENDGAPEETPDGKKGGESTQPPDKEKPGESTQSPDKENHAGEGEEQSDKEKADKEG